VPDMTYNVFGGTLNLAQSQSHTTVYVEAIELDDMADTPFHSLDKYKRNLTAIS